MDGLKWKIQLKWMMTGGTPLSGPLHLVIRSNQDLSAEADMCRFANERKQDIMRLFRRACGVVTLPKQTEISRSCTVVPPAKMCLLVYKAHYGDI